MDYALTTSPDGAFQAVKGIRFADVTDGLSNTLMVGEKHVPQGSLGAYPWDCSTYDGHHPVCNTRSAGPGFPLAVSREDTGWKFGSPPGRLPVRLLRRGRAPPAEDDQPGHPGPAGPAQRRPGHPPVLTGPGR